MEKKLTLSADGKLYINDVEIPFAELVDIHIEAAEMPVATIRLTVNAVDIPGYPLIQCNLKSNEKVS